MTHKDLTGIIILGHGSPNEHEYVRVMDYIINGVRTGFGPEVKVLWAALKFNHPDPSEAIGILAKQGVKNIIVMPFFLFEGKHSAEDIPALIKRGLLSYPDIAYTITGTLGTDKLIADLVIKRIRQAMSGPISTEKALPLPCLPEDIESRSMEIIEGLLPLLECSQEERQVIKRIVHASGDVDIANLVRFHPHATTAGIDAIRGGKSIVADVKMVASGINRKKAAVFGCSINCALDEPKVVVQAPKGKGTRAAAAIRYLGTALDDAIVVIGNAPTALFALIDLIDHNGIKPAMIIGMPVGFVGASESKTALMQRNIPYITVDGTRGGSALAVAATNALLNIA